MLKFRSLPCLLALAAAFAAAVPARAGEDTTAQLRDELGAMRLQLAERGLFADLTSSAAPLTVELPADRRVDLGLVVDSTDAAHARDGLHVLAVSPGGLGARMGVRAGDVLTRVNAQPLTGLGADGAGRAAAAARLREVLDALPDGAAMALDVDRGGRTLALQAPLERVALPAMRVELGASADPAPADGSTCARISTFDVAPRDRHIYPVALLLIDGANAGVRGQQNFRVAPGQHVLTVVEHIDRVQLPSTLIARTGRDSQVSTKTLTIDVQPGVLYNLGAQLHIDRLSSPGADEAWWTPVVWRTAPIRCP
ncbi:MAG TPA: PDZ domain-containing protein [Mizugakiibacter sp.]